MRMAFRLRQCSEHQFHLVNNQFVFICNLNVKFVCFIGLSAEIGSPTQYSAEVLTRSALEVIENALWDPRPENRYQLAVPNSRLHAFKMTCRNSFRGLKPMPPYPTMIQV